MCVCVHGVECVTQCRSSAGRRRRRCARRPRWRPGTRSRPSKAAREGRSSQKIDAVASNDNLRRPAARRFPSPSPHSLSLLSSTKFQTCLKSFFMHFYTIHLFPFQTIQYFFTTKERRIIEEPPWCTLFLCTSFPVLENFV